jgi:hypothetical protein
MRHVPTPLVLVAALLATFLIRVFYPGQPIVENYVGRQIPTAMVARNLDRGSGVLRPQLETAPFPNYFVVEPPVYESLVVTVERVSGLRLSQAGRIVSALATVLAAWGLFGLARRREGGRVALAAVAVFAVFPLLIRYGRAFQPDAAMLGAVVAGMACWDRYQASRSPRWLVAGWSLLAIGFAIKITAGFVLVPLFVIMGRERRAWEVIVALSSLMPALLWYLWAAHLVEQGAGSLASADNRTIWLGLLGPSALLQPATIKTVSSSLLIRAFTPLGAALAIFGLIKRHGATAINDGLWWVWGGSTLLAMALLAGKLHHEYYWLPLAPVAAVGAARALEVVARKGHALAGLLAAALVALCLVQARSTWRTPPEWRTLAPAARAVSAIVPRGAWVAASEALLFQADRRGCRMEWTPAAAGRAAQEWGGHPSVDSPLELLEYYRHRGARYFADLGSGGTDPERKGLHDVVRRRYKVIVDSPEVIIADLTDSGTHWNAN